ncbi:PRC-barrel domain-containing protein [Caenispirillum bisanense]|uniref:PRC-barrel domain-containing protein n=1 Tax=Caenispirillum bisanense TaxID=414052 RepID=A0A286GHH9_9PROT|nr:PRC-barrel domain-containing protein [Caenispirillum bisanense]SOD94968.1 PRC-barrel domain-containing protein [Caenispirillum bisanense]
MKIATLALAAATLALPGAALAQAQNQPTTQSQQQAAIGASQFHDVDDLAVMTQDGKRLGEIENVLVDGSGTMAYVVEIEDGFLGMNETEVVVPADRLSFDAQNRGFTTTMTEADIKGLQAWED